MDVNASKNKATNTKKAASNKASSRNKEQTPRLRRHDRRGGTAHLTSVRNGVKLRPASKPSYENHGVQEHPGCEEPLQALCCSRHSDRTSSPLVSHASKNIYYTREDIGRPVQ